MNRNDDEQLISKFMRENRHEIADNGFSRRVMRGLPVRAKVVSDVLTAVCVVLCCILFYVYDGMTLLLEALHSFLQYQTLNALNDNINLGTLVPVLAVLAYFGVRRAYTVKI